MTMSRKISRTLFDPLFYEHDNSFRKLRLPYTLIVDALSKRQDQRFSETELCAFRDVLRHETETNGPFQDQGSKPESLNGDGPDAGE